MLIELLRELVAINSISPTLSSGPGEREIIRWVEAWLKDAGIASTVWEAAPGRPNLVARVAGEDDASPLLLNAHVDTVGVEEMDEPFRLRQEGDRLYGRGAFDMKGSIAIMLALSAHFRDNPPPGDVWLTLVSDEEDLSLGMESLVRDWLPTLEHPPAAALVLEPTDEAIGVAHKGFVWYELEIRGRAAHGSQPWNGVDAIVPLGAALQELSTMEETFREGGTRHPLLGRPSLHASIVQGGSAWSVYPSQALLRWERRILPGEENATLDEELARVVTAAGAVNEATASGRRVFERYPLQTPHDSPLVQAIRHAAPGAELTGLPFWTDGALLSTAGIPTVIYGPSGEGAHAREEWLSAASMNHIYTTVEAVIARGLSGFMPG